MLAVIIMIAGTAPAFQIVKGFASENAHLMAEEIISYKTDKAGASDVQQWINGELTQNAGVSSEWYIITLSQNGSYDFSSYRSALESYLAGNTIKSASSRQKYALALIASGSKSEYISSVMEDSIGQQGVMSWIFGLHLLSNGYTSSKYTTDSVTEKLLSLQLSDGGWAVMGSSGDIDVTAMALQALAPQYSSNASVAQAVEKALEMLSSRQLEEGDYASYGAANAESTAQVLTALSTLNIDAASDLRFIKNGNTLFDGLEKYRLPDGGYSHKLSGATDENAIAQVLFSLVSYNRMRSGKSSFYILDSRNPTAIAPVKPAATENVTEAPAEKPQSSTAAAEEQAETEAVQEESSESITEEPVTTVSDESMTSVTEGVSADKAEKITETTALSSDKREASEEATANEQSSKAEKELADENEKKSGYKLWASLILWSLAALTCIALVLLKKRSKKTFIAVLVIAAAVQIFILATDFQSADDYYNGQSKGKENVAGTVTLTIRCDTIAGKGDSEYIPDNGEILAETEFPIEDGDTVFDILTQAAREYNIQTESSGSEGMKYVSGINYIYEYDFGDLSGWMYYVNGESPSVGCDAYTLSDRDRIEWQYTCSMGKDLE